MWRVALDGRALRPRFFGHTIEEDPAVRLEVDRAFDDLRAEFVFNNPNAKVRLT